VKEKDKLMTPQEVCAYLKISRRTLYSLIKQGRLPTFKIGGQWRFKYGEVYEYLRGEALSQPKFYKPEVLEEYRAQPDKYEIREDATSGWLSMKKTAPEAAQHFYQFFRFTQVKLKTGETVLRVMPASISQLPDAEKRHWAFHQIS
jgi:excisionase family DNA binding protein